MELEKDNIPKLILNDTKIIKNFKRNRIILMDIDGVLRGTKKTLSKRTLKKIIEEISKSRTDVVWCSTWEHESNSFLKHFGFHTDFPNIQFSWDNIFKGLHKKDTFERFLNNPALRGFNILVIDDEFNLDWKFEGNRRIYHIIPTTETGMNESEIEILKDFLK